MGYVPQPLARRPEKPTAPPNIRYLEGSLRMEYVVRHERPKKRWSWVWPGADTASRYALLGNALLFLISLGARGHWPLRRVEVQGSPPRLLTKTEHGVTVLPPTPPGPPLRDMP